MASPLTILQRLLRYPHGVFDKRPGAELAIRIQHMAGCRWKVAEEVLTLTVGDDAAVHTYDLADRTLVQLSMDLIDDGFDVPYLSPTLRSLSAAVLIEGSGDQHRSNGDHLNAYTSLLWVILSAYARELRVAGVQKEEALRQMVIPQAEGYWLDVWGLIYGIGRNAGETDGDYAPRIPEEAFRLRVNALAIEKAIKDITGKDVRIREPWVNMFRLDESKLSGSDRLYDGSNYGYHLIQPVSNSVIDWDDVLPIIERNRPAGVLVLRPSMEMAGWVDARLNGTVWSGGTSLIGTYTTAWQNAALGWMVLDQDDLVRNYRSATLSIRSSFNRKGISWKEAGGKWDSRKWRMDTTITDLVGAVSSAATQIRASLTSVGPDFGKVYRSVPPVLASAFIAYLLPAIAEYGGTTTMASEISEPLDGEAWSAGKTMPGTWADGGTWEAGRTWGGTNIPMS